MKFKATKRGFMGSRIYPGQVFEAPDDFKASWAEPVEVEKKKPEKTASRKKKRSKKTD